MSQLPTSLRLGGMEWTLDYLPPSQMPDTLGLCHLDEGRISIRQGQTLPSTVDTVLHETFHAILHSQGREYGGKTEETYVRALATGLLGALQDNPEFAQWLLTYRHKK